jgi:hypothetical protein
MPSLVVTFPDLPDGAVAGVRAAVQSLAAGLGVAVRIVPVAQGGRRDEVRAASGLVGVQDEET